MAEQEIEKAVQLASVAADRYPRYSPETRRRFNKALFDPIYFEDKRIVRHDWSEAVAPLMRTATSLGGGSTKASMVEPAGLEPATFWLPARRSPS